VGGEFTNWVGHDFGIYFLIPLHKIQHGSEVGVTPIKVPALFKWGKTGWPYLGGSVFGNLDLNLSIGILIVSSIKNECFKLN
jgi:hypothetical protein